MKAPEVISQKEHKFLLGFVFIWVVFILSVFCWEAVTDYNDAVFSQQVELAELKGIITKNSFAVDAVPKTFLSIHFISVFILILTAVSKRIFFSTIITIFYFCALIYAVVSRHDKFFNSFFGDEDYSANVSLFRKFDVAANDVDVLAVLFISILLFWQISILLRMLINKSQRKNELP